MRADKPKVLNTFIILTMFFGVNTYALDRVQRSALNTTSLDSADETWNQIISDQERTRNPVFLTPLPEHAGVQTSDLLELVVNHYFKKDTDMSESWPFAVRSRRLLTNSENFSLPKKMKWLHPKGVCARGRWIIPETSSSNFTGLFSKDTSVPAVVRLSTGTNDSQRLDEKGKPKGRIYGMAVKLFHAEDSSAKAITSNILTLDHKGFSRSKRPKMLQKFASEGKLYFTTNSPVENIIGSENGFLAFMGKLLSKALDMFDDPNFSRPVYVSANYDTDGNRVANAKVPREVRLVPKFPDLSKDFSDFRYELLSYEQGYFDVEVIDSTRFSVSRKRIIGRLEIDFPFIISDTCDRSLSFHHSPNEWKEAYEK
ncbi:MAG: hypothetical protein CME65_01315 [Halobacteriovoraceae bacterium]|nr:hypothetical protein [Halobacteriovoraceae bacterium]|tara:strand:+ start:1551 stop:2660 length:1110 start_codon:yes stop_codon:yes gene_type:complete